MSGQTRFLGKNPSAANRSRMSKVHLRYNTAITTKLAITVHPRGPSMVVRVVWRTEFYAWAFISYYLVVVLPDQVQGGRLPR